MGIPMDVSIAQMRKNGECFKCREKGHYARDCPRGRDAIRAILNALDPEDRLEFAEELQGLPESAFISEAEDDVATRALIEDLKEVDQQNETEGFVVSQA